MLTWTEFNEKIKGEAYDCSVILNRQQRKYEYKHYLKEFEVKDPINNMSDFIEMWNQTKMNCLAPTPVECTPPKKSLWGSDKKKDVNPMSAYAHATMIAAPVDPDAAKRSRLDYRLSDIYSTKKAELRKKFGLIDDDAPKTAKEMDERIKAGKFIIKGLDDEKRRYFYWNEAIRWRDPSVVEDQDGYEAAKATLKKAYVETQDIIAIKDPSEGLEAMKAFEAREAS